MKGKKNLKIEADTHAALRALTGMSPYRIETLADRFIWVGMLQYARETPGRMAVLAETVSPERLQSELETATPQAKPKRPRKPG